MQMQFMSQSRVFTCVLPYRGVCIVSVQKGVHSILQLRRQWQLLIDDSSFYKTHWTVCNNSSKYRELWEVWTPAQTSWFYERLVDVVFQDHLCWESDSLEDILFLRDKLDFEFVCVMSDKQYDLAFSIK